MGGHATHTKTDIAVTVDRREAAATRRARVAMKADPGAAAHHAPEGPGCLTVGRFIIGIQAPFPDIAAQIRDALQGIALGVNAHGGGSLQIIRTSFSP